MKKLLTLSLWILAFVATYQQDAQGQVLINSYVINGYDADAMAGFTAAGVDDPTQRNAINAFIISCKTRGNWSRMVGLWILAGSTSSSQAVNWKSPGTYNLAFTGITHGSSGIQGDGTTNVVDTGIQPSSALTTSTQMGFYTSTATFSATTVADIGLFQAANILELGVYGGSPNAIPRGAVFGTATITGSNSGSTNGFWYVSNFNYPNDCFFYKNGSIAGGSASTLDSPSGLTGTVKLTCRSNNAGTISRRSNKMYGFFFIGLNLSDLPGLSADVLVLMTALGR